MAESMLTTQEAADELGLSHVAVRQAIRRGRLAAVKRGRDNFIARAELERYRREHLGQVGRPKQDN